MKILHTADWHIGQFKGPVVDGVNLRSQDTVKCLEYMVQVAIEEKPDIVCVSGDIFHQEQVGPVRYSDEMITATNIITSLAHFAGAATVGAFFTLWCVIAVQRVRKESEASKYGELCARIQKQIDATRMRISSVKMQLHIADHALDQALLQWKYEYLMKQEQWLVELMCGKIEEKQEEKQ